MTVPTRISCLCRACHCKGWQCYSHPSQRGFITFIHYWKGQQSISYMYHCKGWHSTYLQSPYFAIDEWSTIARVDIQLFCNCHILQFMSDLPLQGLTFNLSAIAIFCNSWVIYHCKGWHSTDLLLPCYCHTLQFMSNLPIRSGAVDWWYGISFAQVSNTEWSNTVNIKSYEWSVIEGGGNLWVIYRWRVGSSRVVCHCRA